MIRLIKAIFISKKEEVYKKPLSWAENYELNKGR